MEDSHISNVNKMISGVGRTIYRISTNYSEHNFVNLFNQGKMLVRACNEDDAVLLYQAVLRYNGHHEYDFDFDDNESLEQLIEWTKYSYTIEEVTNTDLSIAIIWDRLNWTMLVDNNGCIVRQPRPVEKNMVVMIDSSHITCHSVDKSTIQSVENAYGITLLQVTNADTVIYAEEKLDFVPNHCYFRVNVDKDYWMGCEMVMVLLDTGDQELEQEQVEGKPCSITSLIQNYFAGIA